jgi:hypothetical protein
LVVIRDGSSGVAGWQLGLPIVTPHYWAEGFDFSTLAG